MRLLLFSLFFCAAFLASSFVASHSDAIPIGPCGSCAGSVWDLTYDPTPVATTATTETWEITLTVDTSGYTGGGSFVDAVAIKVSGGDDFVIADLVDAPGGVAEWLEVTGGINAFGCSGSGAGFECARDIAPADAAPVSGGPYTWVWEVELQTGTLLTGTNAASIKARYVDGGGLKKGPLLSEDITLSVLEPTVALLLAGPALVGSRRRDRQR